MTTRYTLIIKTDKYTGNFDAALLYTLFGIEDDRYQDYGGKEYRKSMVKDTEFPEEFLETRPNGEYGYMYYAVSDDSNALDVFPDSYVEYDEIIDYVGKLKAVFGDKITLFSWKGEPYEIAVSYQLKTEIISTGIENL